MSPLEQAKQWMDDEKPTTEEIQQSVDNLCHQVARPPSGVTESQLMDAIRFLMGALGKDPSELVLLESTSKAALDLTPLGGTVDVDQPRLSDPERRKRFRELKEELRSPF